MKLKEAQMLGVLALIAVGIILLCMWGGEGDSTAPAADSQQAQASDQAPLEPDLAQLYKDLLGSQPASSDSQGQDAAASMSIGGLSSAPPASASEENALRSVMESVAAQQIPLSQPEPESSAPAAVVQPLVQPTVTHVVAAGETLSAISKKYYGTTSNWKAILDANASVVKDPRDLKPNMRLIIPEAGRKTASAPAPASGQASVLSATAPKLASSARTYTVAKGDTLFRIAMKYYNDGSRYKDILAANRATVSKPQDLRPGMKLVIP